MLEEIESLLAGKENTTYAYWIEVIKFSIIANNLYGKHGVRELNKFLEQANTEDERQAIEDILKIMRKKSYRHSKKNKI